MPTMYSSEFLLTHEVEEKTFSTKEEAERYKKELKAKGFKVKVKKYSDEVYEVIGIKERV